MAISSDRILRVDQDRVLFSFRDRRIGDWLQAMQLDGVSFLKRFLLHVLPKGFVRLRHFGFLANAVKTKNMGKLDHLLKKNGKLPDQSPTSDAPVKPSNSMLGSMTTQPLRCPQCGSRLQRAELSHI